MTNWFEQYYPELIIYAEKKIRQKDLFVQPEETVNDAYIKFVESGVEFDLSEVKKIIRDSLFSDVKIRMKERAVGESDYGNGNIKRYSKKVIAIRGEKVCKGCKENKPVGAFRLYKFEGFTFLSGFCVPCLSKKTNDWQKANKEKWAAYIKKRWQEKNKHRPKKVAKPIQELWQRANKKRYEKEKETLADSYVKRILKAAKKPFTPKDIIEKREELFNKRRNHHEVLH